MTVLRGQALDDFIDTANAAQLREHLVYMRRVFYGGESSESALTPAPPLDGFALARLAQIRATRGQAPGGWNTPERAVTNKELAASRRVPHEPLPTPLTGPYLLAYRKRLGISQRQVAVETGVERGVLDRVEHDRHLLPQSQRQRVTEQRPAREKLLAYYQTVDKTIR